MDVSNIDLSALQRIIVDKLKEEFSLKKLSGNLKNTISVEATTNEIQIKIPAKTYNMLLYQTKGVVIHTSHGSYASKLDTVGSEFYAYSKNGRKNSHLIKPHNHKGYIDRIINDAIREWLGTLQGVKLEKVEGM